MWKYVSNSLIYRFLIFIYEVVGNAYRNSFLNRCVETVAAWNQHGLLYRTKQNYISSTPKYSFSVTYRILSFFGKILDGFAGHVNHVYTKAFKNSLFAKTCRSLLLLWKKIFGRWSGLSCFIILAVVLGVSAYVLPKLVVAGIIGILGLVFILRNFERAAYLVAIYPILYFVAGVSNISFLVSLWDELLIIFCVGIWFYRWVADRKDFNFAWTPVDFSLIIFFVVCIALFAIGSLKTLGFDSLGFDGLRAVIEYMFFFFIVVKLLRSEDGAKNLIKLMILTGVVMSLHGIYQYIAKVETPAYWTDKVEVSSGPRVFSFVGSPNVLGCLLAMLIPLAISLIFSEEDVIQKLLYTAASGIMGICILLTGSRSSWIALGCALIIYSILSRKYYLIIGLFVVAILAYTMVSSVRSRIDYMLDPAYIVSSFTGGRFARWPKALGMFYNNLLFGEGFGRFGGSVATINKVKGAFYVDNYYIKAAVEMGIFGLVTFLAVLYNGVVWSLRASYKVEDKVSRGLIQSGFGAMVGILVTNVVLNNFDAPSVTTYFWTIAAVCVFLGYVKKGPNNVLTNISNKQ
ncbi:O-antigen ligase family protein [Ruminiclostridium cellobioparum]|uniref:O-antigen ligase family protein n=1 Tax=Ruminiclostridium cellobioparum TaxID=29355 RepID=UPI0028AD917C|nr:O-antigen ligase family protein [Ruminiclostridium cellobioparum]